MRCERGVLPPHTGPPVRIAVAGSGISGLAAAWRLAPSHQVSLFAATVFSSLLASRVNGERTPLVGAVGVASLGRRLPASVADDLRFDPWHTGASLRPVGLLNRLRRPAYVASQRSRGVPGA